jgi:hypothetical protein
MSGKVIHLSDEIHARMKAYCTEHDLVASQWVESLIHNAVSGNEEVKRVERESAVVNKKERVDFFTPCASSDDPWAKPPFWDKSEDE